MKKFLILIFLASLVSFSIKHLIADDIPAQESKLEDPNFWDTAKQAEWCVANGSDCTDCFTTGGCPNCEDTSGKDFCPKCCKCPHIDGLLSGNWCG